MDKTVSSAAVTPITNGYIPSPSVHVIRVGAHAKHTLSSVRPHVLDRAPAARPCQYQGTKLAQTQQTSKESKTRSEVCLTLYSESLNTKFQF